MSKNVQLREHKLTSSSRFPVLPSPPPYLLQGTPQDELPQGRQPSSALIGRQNINRVI